VIKDLLRVLLCIFITYTFFFGIGYILASLSTATWSLMKMGSDVRGALFGISGFLSIGVLICFAAHKETEDL